MRSCALQNREINASDYELLLQLDSGPATHLHDFLVALLPPCSAFEAASREGQEEALHPSCPECGTSNAGPARTLPCAHIVHDVSGHCAPPVFMLIMRLIHSYAALILSRFNSWVSLAPIS